MMCLLNAVNVIIIYHKEKLWFFSPPEGPLLPGTWILKIQLKEVKIILNKVFVGTEMGHWMKCSEIELGLCSVKRKTNTVTFCLFFPPQKNLFDVTQVSIFVASWHFMKDDSRLERAKKISEWNWQTCSVCNSAFILCDILNKWFSYVGDSYYCAYPTLQRTQKRTTHWRSHKLHMLTAGHLGVGETSKMRQMKYVGTFKAFVARFFVEFLADL